VRAPRLLIASSVPSTLTAFLLPYAEHYRARGWRVDAVSNGAPDCEACVRAFDQVHHVPWTRSPRDLVNLTLAPRLLRRLVAEHGYHLVHVHDPIAAFVTRFGLRRARQRLGVQVVYTAHGFHFHRGAPALANLVFRSAERLASTWTDHLIVINREDLQAARSFPLGRRGGVTYMPGIGIDTAAYAPERVSDEAVARVRAELGLASGQPLLLMVAELNPGKRHRDAIEALARAGREDVVLAFAGEGPLAEDLAALAARLGIARQVRILGFRDDVPALLRASFALILPSEREGLPRCIMEAASLERPTIATRIRGVVELVDGSSGVLCEVGDIDALSRAIRELADEPERAAAMGAAARERVREFDLTRVLELHDTLYARLLADRSATADATSSMV
jgi:glycosyltransferase involved in cell wall biosynthesis